MKKALFVCYGAGHANLIAPVYERVRRDGNMSAEVLALSVAKNVFAAKGLPYKTITDYEDLIMDGESYRLGKGLATRWHVESSGISLQESIVYLGASMRDLISQVGETEAWREIELKNRQCFLPLTTIQKIIEAEKPDLLVTTNSPRMERAATLVGNKLGISTVNIHDDLGFIARNYVLSADQILVMSDITKENLVHQGHAREKIFVTGHPAFDPIPDELRHFTKAGIVQKYHLPSNKCFVLLGTSQPGERGKIMPVSRLAHDIVAKMDGWHLILKPHPGEDGNAYLQYARTDPGTMTAIPGVNIRELLAASEVLITFASTIFLESILMGKPVISFNQTGKPDPFPFVDWGLGVGATTADGLRAGIQRTTSDSEFGNTFKSAHKKYFSASLDGRATERVAEMLYKAVNRHVTV
jgi:hypothetical protein